MSTTNSSSTTNILSSFWAKEQKFYSFSQPSHHQLCLPHGQEIDIYKFKIQDYSKLQYLGQTLFFETGSKISNNQLVLFSSGHIKEDTIDYVLNMFSTLSDNELNSPVFAKHLYFFKLFINHKFLHHYSFNFNNSSSYKHINHFKHSDFYFQKSFSQIDFPFEKLNLIAQKDTHFTLAPFLNLNSLSLLKIDVLDPKISEKTLNYLITNSCIYGRSYSSTREFPFTSTLINQLNYFGVLIQHLKISFEEANLKIKKFIEHPHIKIYLTREFEIISKQFNKNKHILEELKKAYLQTYYFKDTLKDSFINHHKNLYLNCFKDIRNDINTAKYYWNNNDYMPDDYYNVQLNYRPNSILTLFPEMNATFVLKVLKNNLVVSTKINNLLCSDKKKPFMFHSSLYRQWINDNKALFDIKLFNKNSFIHLSNHQFTDDDLFNLMTNVREKNLTKQLIQSEDQVKRIKKKI